MSGYTTMCCLCASIASWNVSCEKEDIYFCRAPLLWSHRKNDIPSHRFLLYVSIISTYFTICPKIPQKKKKMWAPPKPNSDSKSESKSRNSKSESESMALSVFVENVACEEEPAPLNSHDHDDPRLPRKIQQRRPECVRRSPRLSPLPPAQKEEAVKDTSANAASRKIDDAKSASVRRSPRFTSSVLEEAESSKIKTPSVQVLASLLTVYYL